MPGFSLAVRKIQFAPTRPGRQPSTTVRKDFMFSPGELELEATLDRQLYHHGDDIRVKIIISTINVVATFYCNGTASLSAHIYHISHNMTSFFTSVLQVSFMIRNNSSKMVKRLNVSVVQSIDIAMFTGGHHSARISQLDTTEGCPLGPGSTLQKEVLLSPTAKTHLRTGVALDGRLKGDDTSLARCRHSLFLFAHQLYIPIRVYFFFYVLSTDYNSHIKLN